MQQSCILQHSPSRMRLIQVNGSVRSSIDLATGIFAIFPHEKQNHIAVVNAFFNLFGWHHARTWRMARF